MDAERRADRAVHLAGVILMSLGSIQLVGLVILRADVALAAALLPYCAGLAASFAFSALYNLAPPSPRRERLRRFDHAAIFLLIAGTYNALTLPHADRGWALALLILVWALSIIGIFMKLLLPHRFERWSIAVYLGLGWSFLAVAEYASAVLTPLTFHLIVTGGVFYSAGVVAHILPHLPFGRALWHSAVVAGALCHYAAILLTVGL